MAISLRTVRIPDFGVPIERPAIPAAVYEVRVAALKARAGTDWVVVLWRSASYTANIAFLTGFGAALRGGAAAARAGRCAVLVVGNECSLCAARRASGVSKRCSAGP